MPIHKFQPFESKVKSNRVIKPILLAIFCLSILVYALLGRMKVELVDNAVSDLASIVKSTQNTVIDVWVANLIKDVEGFSQTDQFIEQTERLLTTTDISQIEHQSALTSLRQLLQSFLNTHNAKGIFIISKEGKNIASMRDSNLGIKNLISLKRPDHFQRACRGESLLIPPIKSDVPLTSPSGSMIPEYPTMFLAVPVKNKSGEILAVFAVRLDPFDTFSRIAQNARIKRSGETYIFDRYGTLITESRFNDQLFKLGLIQSPNMSLLHVQIRDPGKNLLESAPSETPLQPQKWPLTYMAQEAIGSKQFGMSTKPYRDYRGVMVYGAWLWNEQHGIGMTTEMDMDETLAPYYEMRRLTTILLSGMIFMATTLLIFISKQQKKSKDQINKLYIDLEKKFQEKTKNLQESEQELKITSQKAQEANRAKSDFLANMSHEIRTPMNGILGFANILTETKLDEEQKECASLIVHSCRSLLVIINDILDFSKIEAGKMSLEKISMDINVVVDDVFRLYQEAAQEKGITISKVLDPSIPEYILGDPTRVRQIVLNLFSNAIKFTEKGSIMIHVKIETTQSNAKFLKIEIQDTGIGIDPKHLDHIFQSFTQADLSTTRQFGGTGLGTTISQKLVHLMHGEMGVTSELGVGSCFYFTIPLEATKEKYIHKELIANSTRDYQQTIIVAEDNLINQKLAKRTFNKLGIEVIIANNGQEAIQLANTEPHSLIMMDIQMPVMNGIDATQQLKKDGYNKPIIAMTANVLESDRQKYLDIGMADCVPKPFKQQELILILDQFLTPSEKKA